MIKPKDWTAPDGCMFVCLACGKHGTQRDEIGDEACFLAARLVRNEDVAFEDGHVIRVGPAVRR